MNDSIKEKIVEKAIEYSITFRHDKKEWARGAWARTDFEQGAEFGVSLMESEVSELKAKFQKGLEEQTRWNVQAIVNGGPRVKEVFDLNQSQSEEIASLKAVLKRVKDWHDEYAKELKFDLDFDDYEPFLEIIQDIHDIDNLNPKSL